MKTLSFIIPLYNSAKWLEKCLYSVLEQDIPESEMEIICVNDGSPDNSAELAREIGTIHPSIKVIDQPNQGPSGARNTGMKAATGKYLAFVDPDDYVEPNVYGLLVRQMEDEQLDMLRFDYQIVDESYRHVEKRPFEKAFDYTPKLMSGAEFLATRLDIACNIWRYIYRREIITSNNIWCFTGDYYDDTPWLPLVLLKAQRLNICDTVVYNYLERSDSLVKTRAPHMQKRKSDGRMLLLRLLQNEKRDIAKKDIVVPIEWERGVMQWYENMLSQVVLALLTTVAIYQYEERKNILGWLSEHGLFPLCNISSSKAVRRKIRIINISPRLFMCLIRFKNKRK